MKRIENTIMKNKDYSKYCYRLGSTYGLPFYTENTTYPIVAQDNVEGYCSPPKSSLQYFYYYDPVEMQWKDPMFQNSSQFELLFEKFQTAVLSYPSTDPQAAYFVSESLLSLIPFKFFFFTSQRRMSDVD